MAVFVSLLGLVISGCADPGDSVSTTNGAGPSSPSVTEAEGLLDEIDGGMSGTQAQGDAVRYLEHVTYQGIITDCMAGQGFVYEGVPAFRVPSPIGRLGGPEGVLNPVDPAAVEADELGLDAALAGIVDNARAGEPIVLDTGETGGPPVPEHEVPGWDDAQEGCHPDIEDLDARVDHPSYERADQTPDPARR